VRQKQSTIKNAVAFAYKQTKQATKNQRIAVPLIAYFACE
jgi:hypothetical protein